MVTIILPIDSTGYKRKVKSRFFSFDEDFRLKNGSILLRYIDPNTEADLPDGGTVSEKRLKSEREIVLLGGGDNSNVLDRFIDANTLLYVTEETANSKLVKNWVTQRSQSQLQSVPANPDTQMMLEGVLRKIVQIMQANGEL